MLALIVVEVDAEVALAQLLVVRVNQQSNVGEPRRLPAKSMIEGEVFRRRWKPFLRPELTSSLVLDEMHSHCLG